MPPVRRVVSALLALVLVLGGLLATIEIVLALLGKDPWLVPRDEWSAWFREQTWESTTIRAILVGLVLAGLVLLVVAFRRGRPTALPLAPGTAGPAAVTMTASRRGVERTLAQVARESEGVTSAQATVSRHRATVRATGRTQAPEDLRGRIESAVADQLSDLGLADPLTSKVRVTSKGER